MSRRRSRTRQPLTFEDLRDRRTVSYVRESTERQAQADRFGPDSQRAIVRATVERHGLRAPEREYFDAASGRQVERRPGLEQAFNNAAPGDVILIAYTSRAFRNRHEAAIWKQRAQAAGIVLVFCENGIISGNADSALNEGVLEVLDEHYSRDLGGRITTALRAKFERGLHNGRPPLGYRRFRGQPGDPRNGELEVVEAEAATVRAMFEHYGAGDASYATVAMRLNAEGLRARGGAPLSKHLVEEALRNRVYIGLATWHPGTPEEEVRPGLHEPLVTPEAFAVAAAIREGRTSWEGGRPHGRAYPLSRPAVCRVCGAGFKGDTGGRRGSRRYRHRTDRPCINAKSFAADVLEAQFGEVLATRLQLPDDWQASIRRLLGAPPADPHAAERARIEQAIARAAELYQWGDLERDQYLARRDDLRREAARMAPPPVTDLRDMTRAAELLRDIASLWQSPHLSDERRRELVDELVERVEFSEQGIAALLLREEYRPLAATAEAARRDVGSLVVGETGFEPATS